MQVIRNKIKVESVFINKKTSEPYIRYFLNETLHRIPINEFLEKGLNALVDADWRSVIEGWSKL